MSDFEPAPLESATRLSWYPWLIVGTTCIGAFIGQLDASIVQLALPALERNFDVSLNAVSWVAIAYSLTFASILSLFARFSEIFGRKLPCLARCASPNPRSDVDCPRTQRSAGLGRSLTHADLYFPGSYDPFVILRRARTPDDSAVARS
jgi:MFS family permease